MKIIFTLLITVSKFLVIIKLYIIKLKKLLQQVHIFILKLTFLISEAFPLIIYQNIFIFILCIKISMYRKY